MAASVIITSCRPADKVAYNVSKEADEFQVTRRLTVVNTRSDNIMFELEGTFSIKKEEDGDLAIICKVGEDKYKKHFVYLNEWVTYVCEDISGADVNPYHYEVKIYSIIPHIEVDTH
jgi:hypothetical protein